MQTQPMSSHAQSSSRETARLSTPASATLARAVTPWSSWRHAVTSDGAHAYLHAEAIFDEADPSLWEGTGALGRVKLHRGHRWFKV